MQTEEIRRLLEQDKLIIGHNEAKRAIQAGEVAKLLVADNAPADATLSISNQASMANVEVVELSVRNDELGTACRQPFQISFIAVKK